jgi:AcrR family transcriptional regulator
MIHQTKVPDRRVARTRKVLREALHSLIREKDYDAIVVKEILDRADVGRSAFYTHFRDKDELLASSIYEILGSIPSTHPEAGNDRLERILWFSLPIFEHLHRQRQAGGLMLGPRGRDVLHRHLQKVLADLIAESIRDFFPGRRKSAPHVPPELLAQHIASTFVLVLNWWVEGRKLLPPKEVDGLFRSLILPTLAPLSD